MVDALDYFWRVAEPFLAESDIEKGTMMGYPCLRTGGLFFASVHPESGDLIIKLSSKRVQDLIAQGIGKEFAPNGRTFREWVVIPRGDLTHAKELWSELLAEARRFVKRD